MQIVSAQESKFPAPFPESGFGVRESRSLRSKMADEINCYTAEDISELAKVKLETLAYWRKHGKGPKPIRFGDAYLYPKIAVMEFISGLMETDQEDFIRRCI